jgi:protein tyrosine phosphatase (PTP) superfamily phosphohydrolase (DUF442 family)
LAKKWWLRQFFASWSDGIKAARGRMDTPYRRLLGHVETVFIDHSMFRALYQNRYLVGGGMWRSAQVSPAQVKAAADAGIRTIVNLRGARDCASYILEAEACRAHGLTLVDFPVNSRAAPKKETLREAAAIFARIEYPALMHCKSGADRAGLMAALYLLVHEKRPLAEARRQLHWRYGHFRAARTGVLDHVLDLYGAAETRFGGDFFAWLDQEYDPEEAQRTFRSRAWADTVVDRVLERE